MRKVKERCKTKQRQQAGINSHTHVHIQQITGSLGLMNEWGSLPHPVTGFEIFCWILKVLFKKPTKDGQFCVCVWGGGGCGCVGIQLTTSGIISQIGYTQTGILNSHLFKMLMQVSVWTFILQ